MNQPTGLAVGIRVLDNVVLDFWLSCWIVKAIRLP